MATPYADLLVRFRADKKDFDTKTRDVNQKLNVLDKAAKRAQLAVAGIVSFQTIRKMGELAQRGGELSNIFRATQNATGNLDGSLSKLRVATNGLINDFDLAVGLNKALTLGSAQSADQFAELASVSQQLGRALGIDAAYALESLNIGISRQSKLFLDNLGIILDVEQANERYAQSLGKTAKELNESEKAEAFRIAALEAARDAISDLGSTAINNADRIAQIGVALGNIRDRAAEAAARSTTLGRVLDGLRAVIAGPGGGAGMFAQDMFEGIADLPRRFNLESVIVSMQLINDQLDMLRQARDVGASVQGIKDIDLAIASLEMSLVEYQRRASELQATIVGDFEQIVTAVAPLGTQLTFSVETAQRFVDALEAAKEAIAAAEFADALNPSDETRKNLEEAREELERILDAANKIGGLGKLEILLEAVPERRPPGASLPRAFGPGTLGEFELPGISMPRTVPRSTEAQSSMFSRIFGSLDLSNTLETALGGLLTGGINSLIGAGIGAVGGIFGRLFGGGEDEQRRQEAIEAQRKLAEQIAKNTEVVDQNTDAILGGIFGQVKGTDFAAVLDAIALLREGPPPIDEGRQTEEEQQFADAYNAAMDLIAELASELNFTIDWAELDKSLSEFQQALLTTVYSLNTFAGGFDFLQRQFALLDIEDAGQQFEMAIEFMAGLVGEDLAATLRGMIDNTADFGEFIDQILTAIQDPESFIELMSDLQGVSISEFLNWLGFTESALDRLEDSANSAAEALRNVPTGFKYALSVFEASDPVSRSASSTTDLVMGAAGGGGVNVVINVSGAGNPQEVAQAVAKEFRREYERGGYGNQRLAGIGR